MERLLTQNIIGINEQDKFTALIVLLSMNSLGN